MLFGCFLHSEYLLVEVVCIAACMLFNKLNVANYIRSTTVVRKYCNKNKYAKQLKKYNYNTVN